MPSSLLRPGCVGGSCAMDAVLGAAPGTLGVELVAANTSETTRAVTASCTTWCITSFRRPAGRLSIADWAQARIDDGSVGVCGPKGLERRSEELASRGRSDRNGLQLQLVPQVRRIEQAPRLKQGVPRHGRQIRGEAHGAVEQVRVFDDFVDHAPRIRFVGAE